MEPQRKGRLGVRAAWRGAARQGAARRLQRKLREGAASPTVPGRAGPGSRGGTTMSRQWQRTSSAARDGAGCGRALRGRQRAAQRGGSGIVIVGTGSRSSRRYCWRRCRARSPPVYRGCGPPPKKGRRASHHGVFLLPRSSSEGRQPAARTARREETLRGGRKPRRIPRRRVNGVLIE